MYFAVRSHVSYLEPKATKVYFVAYVNWLVYVVAVSFREEINLMEVCATML